MIEVTLRLNTYEITPERLENRDLDVPDRLEPRLHALVIQITELPANNEVAVLLRTATVDENWKGHVNSAPPEVQGDKSVREVEPSYCAG
jgi:hypothetical protein